MKIGSLSNGGSGEFYGPEILGEMQIDSQRIATSNWLVYLVQLEISTYVMIEHIDDIKGAEMFAIVDQNDDFLRHRPQQIIAGSALIQYLQNKQLMVDTEGRLPKLICH